MKLLISIDNTKFRIPIKSGEHGAREGGEEERVLVSWLSAEILRRYSTAASLPLESLSLSSLKNKRTGRRLDEGDAVHDVCQDGDEIRAKLGPIFYSAPGDGAGEESTDERQASGGSGARRGDARRDSKHRPLPDSAPELRRILEKKAASFERSRDAGAPTDELALLQKKIDVLKRKLREAEARASPSVGGDGTASAASERSGTASRGSSKESIDPLDRDRARKSSSGAPSLHASPSYSFSRNKSRERTATDSRAEASESTKSGGGGDDDFASVLAESPVRVNIVLPTGRTRRMMFLGSTTIEEAAEMVSDAAALSASGVDPSSKETFALSTSLEGDTVLSPTASLTSAGIGDGTTLFATVPTSSRSLSRSGATSASSDGFLSSLRGRLSKTGSMRSAEMEEAISQVNGGANDGSSTPSSKVRSFEVVVRVPELRSAPVATLRTNQIVADAVDQLCGELDLPSRSMRLWLPHADTPLPMSTFMSAWVGKTSEFVLKEGPVSETALVSSTSSVGETLRRRKAAAEERGRDGGDGGDGGGGGGGGGGGDGDGASAGEGTPRSADAGSLNLSTRIFQIMDDLETTQAAQESTIAEAASESSLSTSGRSLNDSSHGGGDPSGGSSLASSPSSSARALNPLRRFSAGRRNSVSGDIGAEMAAAAGVVGGLADSMSNLGASTGSPQSARDRSASRGDEVSPNTRADHARMLAGRTRSGSVGARGTGALASSGNVASAQPSVGDAVAEGDAERLYVALAPSIMLAEMLGKGGSCTEVYRATSRGLTFAVKVFDTTYITKAEVESINREIELMQRFRHDNIVTYLFHFVPNDAPREIWLCMEYFATPTLYDVIVKRRAASESLQPTEMTEYCMQIARGLRYLHSALDAPVIHRDLKSENVFFARDARTSRVVLKIGDFGESVMGTKAYFGWRRKILKGANVGTAEFRAPELHREKAEGASPYTEKVDIWSFGMVLFEMLTLDIPYRQENLSRFDIPKHIRRGIRPTMSPLDAAGDRAPLVDVFKRCTELDVTVRPTARDIIQLLKKIQDDQEKQ